MPMEAYPDVSVQTPDGTLRVCQPVTVVYDTLSDSAVTLAAGEPEITLAGRPISRDQAEQLIKAAREAQA